MSIPWKKSDALVLVWKEQQLGTVTLTGADQPHVYGDYKPNDSAESFRDFFAKWREQGLLVSGPLAGFDPEFSEQDFWMLIVREDGSELPISVPHVDWDEGSIGFRWAW